VTKSRGSRAEAFSIAEPSSVTPGGVALATMDDQPEPEGMGPTPTGPGFAPWRPDEDRAQAAERASRLGGQQPPVGISAASFAPSKSRRPAALTAAVVLLVAAVVLGGTWMAQRNDARITAPSATPAPARTALPLREDSIEISSQAGSGRLVIVDHRWSSSGREAPRTGTTLEVTVQLLCTSGEISYDPYFFQAFDQTGRLFEVLSSGTAGRLETGTLGPDEQVGGTISFDMPRGQVTLLMTDESTQSVTALKIPD
jgi:hypothetical protein